jgi:deazaflavin-dependent oxidoreductase (nitroreductase family)
VAPNDFNQKIIDEFRGNGGEVGGPFQGSSLLLLHTVGRRSGQPHVNPLAYQKTDDGWAVFASFAGAPVNPAWYHNLVAAPETTIEVGPDTVPVRARVAEGGERDRIFDRQKETVPVFADYESQTGGRVIPVVILQPR